MRPTDGGGSGIDSADLAGAAVVVVVAGGTAAAASGSSNAGPILTFVGAILVGLITWYATDRRQRRLLAAEDTRHKAELEAQEKRHAAQLAHDRSLRDLDDLRRFLDDAADAYEAVVRRVVELHRLKFGARKYPEGEVGLRVVELEKNDGEEWFRVLVVARRTGLRFPAGHRVPEAYGDAVDAIIAEHKLLAETPAPVSDADLQAAYERGEQTAEAWRAFIEAASEVIGAGDTSLPRSVAGQDRRPALSPPESTEDGAA